MGFHAHAGVRARGLLAITLFISTVSFPVAAQWWKGGNRPQGAMGNAEPTAFDRNSLNDVRNVLARAVSEGNYEKIQRMHDEFVQKKTRTTDGTWLVEGMQDYFDSFFEAWPEDRSDAMLKAWEQKVPASKLRPVVAAMRWQRLAWNARGSGSGSSVPGEGKQLFRENLAKAAAALKASEATGKDSPLWYWTALIVAGSSGQPTEAFDTLFEEAVARYPTYQTLHFTRVNYLLPQWGGNFKRVDAFVDKAVARTMASEGTAFYVWLYVDVSRKVDGDYLKETAATWPKMKQGFDDLVARYPDTWNKNLYATFACRARDREATIRMLRELGDKAQLGAWSEGVTTEGCKRFAFDKA